MINHRTKTAVLAFAMLAIGVPVAQAATIGPTAYLQFSDSPFAAVDFSGGYFYLENFEDHALSTPGAAGITGGADLSSVRSCLPRFGR